MTYEELHQMYEELTLTQLAKEMVRLKEAKTQADEALKAATAEFDLVRLKVVPDKMSELDISSMNINGVGRLGIAGDAYCSTLKGQKGALFQWMEDNDHVSLITEVINPSTLKAFIKEQKDLGNPIPDDTIISYTPFLRASVTKK